MALARLSDSSLTRLDGDLALHRAVGVALDDDPRGAELAGELGDLFEHVLDVRVVQLLDRLAVRPSRLTFLNRSQLLGKKCMTTVLVRISSPSARTACSSLGATWVPYSSFCDAYFASLPSFWMIEKSITWSNGTGRWRDRADPAIEQVRPAARSARSSSGCSG